MGVVCNKLGLCPLRTHLSPSPHGYTLRQADLHALKSTQLKTFCEHFQRLDSSEAQRLRSGDHCDILRSAQRIDSRKTEEKNIKFSD